MASQTNHGFVCGQLRQRGGIDSVDFKKIGGSLDHSPLVAVKEGLAFGDMEGVGGGDFEEVAVTVEIHVLRLGYGRFQRIFVADPGQAAPRLNLFLVNRVDLFAGQKEGYLFQGRNFRETAYSESRRNKPACNVVVFRWASLNRSSEAYRIPEDFSFSRSFLSFGSIDDCAVVFR
jgi:hypothetical protein